MRYVFICNRFGSKSITELIPKIEKVCKNIGINYIIEINDFGIQTEDILKKYQDSLNIIMVVGGDGTINRVVNSIARTKNILGVIPFGTGNDFQKTIDETLNDGINDIDLVKINDKYFVNVACFGIDSDIACDDFFIRNNKLPESQRYNMSVIYHFFKYKPRNLKIIYEDKLIRDSFTTVVAANGRYYGGKYKIGTNALPNDGLLDLYIVKKMPKILMAKTIMGMENGSHEYSPYVKKVMTKQLTIKSILPITGNIDGEKIISDVFNIEIINNGLKVYKDKELVKKII